MSFVGQNEFHTKIYTQACEEADKVRPHVAFTAWIKAIREATIVELLPEVDWTDNETIIQVRRMTAQDLESHVDLPESKHEYEDTLHVIKLPLPIPGVNLSDASQFLFVRPDEYALFKCFTLHQKCILTGNPGISKSWFQWKFILFCYRLDLFDRFAPVIEEILLDVPKTEDQMSKEQVQVIPAEPFIPQLIVRTEAGQESWLFFVGLKADVLRVKHDITSIREFTDENTTILWEPRETSTPVFYSGVQARIIATVSPNEARIHDFLKEAIMFFMPCPSELQIRLIGQVYRRFSKELKNRHTDAEIHQRVKNFGPFIRTSVCWESIKMKRFIDNRLEEIEGLVTDPTKLRSRIQIMEPVTGKRLSHRSVRFVVHRDSTAAFLGYTHDNYEFSCDDVPRLIQVAIAKMAIHLVKAHLIAINQDGIGLSDRLPVFLERIFEFHCIDKGIIWSYCPMLLKRNNGPLNWGPFWVKKFKSVERIITTFQSMEENVLYYPANKSFPLVDMYYKNKSGLVGIQATMGKEHSKNVSVYQNFYDQIGTSPETTPLKLYYLIMPCNIDSFETKDKFPPGKFWKDVKSGIAPQWKKNITFFALLPPSSFEAIMPEYKGLKPDTEL